MLSVLNQDYPAIEYMVVDGGSDDGSAEIIQKYVDRLAWWVSEKDQGQADAVNKGIQQAQGKYIGWLNSDDLYLPGTVAKAVAILEANPELGFVFGDVQSIDQDDKVFNLMRYGDWSLSDLMQFKIIGQPGVFMRADLVKQVGGLDLAYHFLLDHHLWLRMGLEAPMRYSGETWAAARMHADAKNVASAAKFGEEAYRLVSWMRADARFKELLPPIQKQVHAAADRFNARYLLDGEHYRASIKSYWRGFGTHFATVWPEWHRFVYACLSLIGLSGLRKLFYRLKFAVKRPDQAE